MEKSPDSEKVRKHHLTNTKNITSFSDQHFFWLIHGLQHYWSFGHTNMHDSIDFGKCQAQFGHPSWSKKYSQYLDVNFNVFEKVDIKDFRLVQNFTMGEEDFRRFIYWGISSSMQQKALVERKTCPQWWYQQCPETLMNNSGRLKFWLTSWPEQIERIVWLCCGTMWTSQSQRVHLLKNDFLQGRSRTRNFKKRYLWNKFLKKFSLHFM